MIADDRAPLNLLLATFMSKFVSMIKWNSLYIIVITIIRRPVSKK